MNEAIITVIGLYGNSKYSDGISQNTAGLRAMKKFLLDDPMDPLWHVEAGVICVAQEEFTDACEHFEAAKILDPSLVTWMNLYIAECKMELKEPEEAIQLLRDNLLLQEEGEIGAALLLANAYMQNNQLAVAGDMLKELLAAHPAEPTIIENVGLFHFRMGDYEKANDCFQQAMELVGDIGRLYMYSAKSLQKLERLHDAVRVSLRGFDRDRNDPRAHQMLSALYAELGDIRNAAFHGYYYRQLTNAQLN